MTQRTAENTRWETAALVAAVAILLSPVIYLLVRGTGEPLPAEAPAGFVGSAKCEACHQSVYKKWRGSDHDKAMAEATDETVLGDFNDARYTDPYNQVTSRFYRREGGFFVETEGPDGKPGVFQISYTFGVSPLQQYLVPFPGGRLQCLNIAWDVEKKEWYRLPPYEKLPPGDWLHWTQGGQRWNVMCAECHSTNVTKGYDPKTGEYRTSWFEINVGCEACHGPGSKHVEWADMPPLARSQSDDMGLVVTTRDLDSAGMIKICAPCHSRRFQLGDNHHTEANLLDLMVPQLLSAGLYYPDGQILDEVYVYGSFVQSKMFARGVRCNDCHDVHGLKIHKQGNALCTQCHRAEVYDTKAHHFHKEFYEGKPSEGHLCVKCHMPGRTYMGIDYRPDHSLRIPRPDLSAELGTPNACTAQGCHADKSLAWNIEACTKWYGQSRKAHYGSAIAAGRAHEPGAETELIRLARDTLLPAIVRATALSLLRDYPGETSQAALAEAIEDPDALIRYTAIRSLEYFDVETRLKRIAPKLYDPVKAVRMEAAMMLSMIPIERLRKDDREAFERALDDYRQAMLYNADLAPQRYNLANLALNQGNEAAAAADYQKAIEIDDRFYPAKVNLAMLYNRQGKNREAEKFLREAATQQPDLPEIAYSLGLLLAEMGNYKDAELYLNKAAQGLNYSRAHYNHGQILLLLNQPDQAEQAFFKAIELSPEDQDAFVALVGLYLNAGQPEKARALAKRLLKEDPGNGAARELIRRMGE